MLSILKRLNIVKYSETSVETLNLFQKKCFMSNEGSEKRISKLIESFRLRLVLCVVQKTIFA